MMSTASAVNNTTLIPDSMVVSEPLSVGRGERVAVHHTHSYLHGESALTGTASNLAEEWAHP